MDRVEVLLTPSYALMTMACVALIVVVTVVAVPTVELEWEDTNVCAADVPHHNVAINVSSASRSRMSVRLRCICQDRDTQHDLGHIHRAGGRPVATGDLDDDARPGDAIIAAGHGGELLRFRPHTVGHGHGFAGRGGLSLECRIVGDGAIVLGARR